MESICKPGTAPVSCPAQERDLFQRVWQRVAPEGTNPLVVPVPDPSPTRPAPEAEGILTLWIDRHHWALCRDRALARRWGGSVGRLSLEQAAGRARFLARLGTEHFLLTGKQYRPRPDRLPVPSPAPLEEALRERCLCSRAWCQELALLPRSCPLWAQMARAEGGWAAADRAELQRLLSSHCLSGRTLLY